MDSFIGWFVVAFGLLVAELLTGTFYLLVISIALAVAGIAALAGASTPLQFVVAAAIGIGGSVWLRSTRFGRRLHERGDDRVQYLFLQAALVFALAVLSRASRYFVSAGLAGLGLLAAALFVRPFLFAALFVEMAAALVVFMLGAEQPAGARGAQRFLVYMTFGMPFILVTGWLLEASL